MRNSSFKVYLFSLMLSLALHFVFIGWDFPLAKAEANTVSGEKLKVCLRQVAMPQKAEAKPVPKAKKTVKERVKKEKKITKKTEKVKKKPQPKPVEKKLKKIIPVEEETSDTEEVTNDVAEEVVAVSEEVLEIEEHLEPAESDSVAKAQTPVVESSKPSFDYDAYMSDIVRLIELNKNYPYLARRKGQEGVVSIDILIGVNGEVIRTELEESSGYGLLDKEAMKLVASVFPLGNSSGEEIRLVIPVRYRLD
jgi:protein TonB